MATEDKKKTAQFGLLMAVVWAIIGSILLWRGTRLWPCIYALAAFFLISTLTYPRLLMPIETIWMKLAHMISLVTTRIILGVTFYLIITPMALIMRLIGRDPLAKKSDPRADTYWTTVDPNGPTSRPNKPY